ncbi:hypothetical protein QZH41_010173, partial [Actinostola sp. cb2023]
EIKRVKFDTVTEEDGSVSNAKHFDRGRTKEEVYVATAFGIIGGLIRSKDLKNCSFFDGNFKNIVDCINSIDLVADYSRRERQTSEEEIEALEEKLILSRKHTESLQIQLEASSSLLKKLRLKEVTNRTPPPNSSIFPPKPDSGYHSSTTQAVSPNIEEISKKNASRPTIKRKTVESRVKSVKKDIDDVCKSRRESLSTVFAQGILAEDEATQSTLDEMVDIITEIKGYKEGFHSIFSGEKWSAYFKSLRRPDWALLYYKLKAKLPDESWQTMLNVTTLGQTGNSRDTPLLLTQSQVIAVRHMIFRIIKETMGIKRNPQASKEAYEVDLESVVVWAIREQRLHNQDGEELEFNLKLDGRSLGGRDQVLVGLVPMNSKSKLQSCKAVYPLVIANCKENRQVDLKNEIKGLVKHLNAQKNVLKKKRGIKVDGREYNLKFTVTADYKALSLLMVKKGDDADDYHLGGKGMDTEFCIYCLTIRVLLAYLHIGAPFLEDFNRVLSQYGPESFKDKRISVKLKPGQESAVEKGNIKVATFSGPTEREILEKLEIIMEVGLPLDKIIHYYKNTQNAAKQILLDRYTFCEYMKTEVIDKKLKDGMHKRDYGTHQETIDLKNLPQLKEYLEKQYCYWDSKQSEIKEKFVKAFPELKHTKKQKHKQPNVLGATYAAELEKEFYTMVFVKWRDLAKTMREEIYEDNQEEEIDIYDMKAKEWGYLLRELFGDRLGTGDYGHLTIEHTAMLFRRFRSFRSYSNQGFEALHRLQRQVYTRATNHDAKIPGKSLEDILVHHYAEKLLFFRLCVNEAAECYISGII